MNERKKGLDETRGALPGRTHARKQAPLLHYACLPTELYLGSPASHYSVLSLTPPTRRSRRSKNKQPRPTMAAPAGATSVGKPNPFPQCQQTKQPGLGVSPSAWDTQPGKAEREALNQVFSAEPGPGVEGRGLRSQRLLLLNEPK